jgi:hypothetical protein
MHDHRRFLGGGAFTVVVALAASTALAGAKIERSFADRLKAHFAGKTAAVLLEDGLPGEAIGPSARGNVTVKIVDGGAWEQKKFLGVKLPATATLTRGVPLHVREIKIKKDGVNVKTVTMDAQLSVDSTKGNVEQLDRQGLNFEFRYSDERRATSDENFAFIVAAVEKYLKLLATPADARGHSQELLGDALPASPKAKPKAGDATARLRQQLEELVGPSHYWNLAVFLNLRRGMTCDEVREVYPALKAGACLAEDYSWPEVPAAKLPLVAKYKFTFKDGRLREAELIFKPMRNKALFKRVSAEVLQAKWGARPPADLESDVLTWTTLDGGLGQRSYSSKRWEIKNGLPRRPSRPLTAAPIEDAERLTRELAALLGPSTAWTFAPLSNLKVGMGCAQVAEEIPDFDMATCGATEPAKVEVLVPGHPLVAYYTLQFRNGGLREIAVALQRYLPKRVVHEVSSRLCQAKWGPKPPAAMADAVVTWIGGNAMAQRSYSVDHWELTTRLPTGEVRTQRKSKARPSKRRRRR